MSSRGISIVLHTLTWAIVEFVEGLRAAETPTQLLPSPLPRIIPNDTPVVSVTLLANQLTVCLALDISSASYYSIEKVSACTAKIMHGGKTHSMLDLTALDSGDPTKPA